MKSGITDTVLSQVVAFHGHLCPGLVIGIRVAEVAMRELGRRAEDEEVVAIVETDNCAVDAIQYLTGCTFGKGNLIHLDHGKNVFTFARRSDGKAIRVVAKPRPSRHLDPDEEALVERGRSGEASEADERALSCLRRERALALLEADESDLFDVESLEGFEVPSKASIHPSVRCDACGQMTMATRVRRLRRRSLCIPCLEEALASGFFMEPIGVVRNDLAPHRTPARARSAESVIEVRPAYAEGLVGIEGCEQLQVLYCFHRAPEDAPLRQYPMGDRAAAERGVFALRSPHRPNPIGLTTVGFVQRRGTELTVSGLDAWDGSPVLDIKPYGTSLDE